MPEIKVQTPRKLIDGGTILWLQRACSSRHNICKITQHNSSSNHYLWIMTAKKESKIHLKRSSDFSVILDGTSNRARLLQSCKRCTWINVTSHTFWNEIFKTDFDPFAQVCVGSHAYCNLCVSGGFTWFFIIKVESISYSWFYKLKLFYYSQYRPDRGQKYNRDTAILICNRKTKRDTMIKQNTCTCSKIH
jgi:hypothetical protein